MSTIDEIRSPNPLRRIGPAPPLSDTTRKLLIAYSTCEKAVMSVHTLEAGIYDALFYGGVITYYSSLSDAEEKILQTYLMYPDINAKLVEQNVLKQIDQIHKKGVNLCLPYPLFDPDKTSSVPKRLWQIYKQWKDIRNKTIAHTEAESKHKYDLSTICVKTPPALGEKPEPYPYGQYVDAKGWPVKDANSRQEFISLISITATLFLELDDAYKEWRNNELYNHP